MKDATIIKITAIVSLSALGIAALLQGIDHVILATISAIIGGIAGYHFKPPATGEKNEAQQD